MKRFMKHSLFKAALLSLLMIFASSPNRALAEPAVKLQKWQGAIDFSTTDTSPFVLEGTASHLGQFTAYGEVDFLPGAEPGSLVGVGPVVFKAANGDLLVGIVTWDVAAPVDSLAAASLHFSWRDSVQFSDGTSAFTTGHFLINRPGGLVVIAIIAILIGMLLPAVQKVP